MTHASVPILKVDHLSYRYPGGQTALSDVSFTVAMNEVVGLVGPNGAGKTTLLLHLNGLLVGTRSPSPPGRGTSAASPKAAEPAYPVEVLGMPVAAPNFPEVRRVVGFLFQDPDDQLFCPTVGEDVAFGPLNLGFPRDEVRRRVSASLEAVGLAGFEPRMPQQLSFGERRRVCLAGILACEPNLLALDEPSSNLDPRSRRRLIEILRSLNAAQIVASHDLELILELCQRVIVLDQGRILADGPTREVLANEALMQAHGLEVPLSIQYGLEIGT
ncbi:MAG TPA: ABC transporter ATP-binding protein [Planctomycetaceae bacterium]|nr:ABC transporter ATP-binding protein [Planctomycetaceae bacterium]